MMIHFLSAEKKKKGVVGWLLNEDSTECLGDCLIILLHGGSILRNITLKLCFHHLVACVFGQVSSLL